MFILGHWKARSGLHISANWTVWTVLVRCYGWGTTGENRSKIRALQTGGSSSIKFSHRRGHPPPSIFAEIVRPMNALQLCRWQFSHKETFFKQSAILHKKTAILRFWAPLGGLGAMYDDHLRLTGKCVVDFLLVLIELFSLGVTAEALRASISLKSAISLQPGPVDPKFQVEGALTPHQPYFSEN